MRTNLSRRFFLQGTGGFMLALPFLGSLLKGRARADATSTPRFIGVYTPHGGVSETSWYPTIPTMTARSLYADHTIYEAALPTSGNLSPVLTSALAPYYAKTNVIRGLDIPMQIGHNRTGYLGNWFKDRNEDPQNAAPAVPSIDQILAYSSKIYPNASGVVRSLQINPYDDNSSATNWQNPTARSGPIVPLSANYNPWVHFQLIFGDGSGSQMPMDNPDVRVVDRVLEDYRALRDGGRLSSEDKLVLEAHIANLSEIEASLRATGLACVAPAEPPSFDFGEAYGNAAINETILRLHVDVLAAAIKCGKTNIATFHLDIVRGMHPGDEWHPWAHDWPNEQAFLVEQHKWVTEKFLAYLLSKLDVPEANGKTYLDNSIVLWGHENSIPHTGMSQPTLTIGSAGGRIATGKFLDYRNRNFNDYLDEGHDFKVGVPYNRFLVTVLQAMGLSPADYELGTPGYASVVADNTNYWRQVHDYYRWDDVGQPLPYLWV